MIKAQGNRDSNGDHRHQRLHDHIHADGEMFVSLVKDAAWQCCAKKPAYNVKNDVPFAGGNTAASGKNNSREDQTTKQVAPQCNADWMVTCGNSKLGKWRCATPCNADNDKHNP